MSKPNSIKQGYSCNFPSILKHNFTSHSHQPSSPISFFFSLMAPLFLSLSLFISLFSLSIFAGQIPSEFLYPNFTTSYLNNSATFLLSPNSTFSLSLYNPNSHSTSFYLSVLHFKSLSPVWTANPSFSLFSFTQTGLSLTLQNSTVWSTPVLSSPAVALRLVDSGELSLLDLNNNSLWSSFSFPTDTLLPGQKLFTNTSLISATSNSDLTPGTYRLLLTSNDLFLQWIIYNNSFVSYWSLSSDLRSIRNSNQPVSYMYFNKTGLYLFSNGTKNTVVFTLLFPPVSNNKELQFIKLDSSGKLQVKSYNNNSQSGLLNPNNILSAPTSDCELPFTCKTLGLCSDGSNGSTCSCPTKFEDSNTGTSCVPVDSTLLLPSENNTCFEKGENMDESSLQISYLSLDIGINYFANTFLFPDLSDVDFSSCENLCSENCSCVGFFYKNISKSCYFLEHKIGSFYSSNTEDSSSLSVGYIKTLNSSKSQSVTDNNSSVTFSKIFLSIFLPCILGLIPIILLYIMFMKWKHNKRTRKNRDTKQDGTNGDLHLLNPRFNTPPSNLSKDELEKEEYISIPGLPTQFIYSDLKSATLNFTTLIGSGGFGSVYKGNLPDKSIVAIKKMANTGLQGKREFLTEIATIGNIRHINLIKLRGFCAEGQNRLLVYEYMNRGSLDQSLFGLGPPIKWAERMEICIGAARGLAYLHSGCDRKIIHCDVKPENILLDDKKGVKIADFGLAKLLTAEQSGLFTTLRGTRGYLAPEWLTNSIITDKTDVYSFGMVLLEIIHGKKNWSKETWSKSVISGVTRTEERYFPMVVLEKHEEKRYEELIDNRIEEKVDKKEIERVVKVALCCLHEDQVMRPSMGFVSAMIEGNLQVWEPKVEFLNYLMVYGRGFMMKNLWGDNDEIVYEGKKEEFESSNRNSDSNNNISGAWYIPSYMSAQELSGPR